MESSSVSIGICAHNEEDTIGKLLEQIIQEDIPLEEIIVVVAGEDDTADIVSEKAEKYQEIELVKEDEREGQIVAQNKIISHITGDALLMVDGDGIIKPGSLEEIYEKFDGRNIFAGKELPVTDNSLLGSVIGEWEKVHHKICLKSHRFSTHLGIIPADLIDSFPEIMLDDVYVENKAREKNLSTKYVEDAVKYHHMPHTLRFFFKQQSKNWTGRFQAEKKGYQHSKPESLVARVFLKHLIGSSFRQLPPLVILGLLEVAAYVNAKQKSFTSSFSVDWWRPKK